MKNNIKPLSRKDEIVVQELNGEVLIYDLRTNKALCLNETSSLVWEACDGNKNVSEISQSISRKLNAPANEDLVWLALDQLKKEKLIANSEEIIPDFNGMSRRDVVKKIGFASLVAVPVITSLVTPVAAQTGSVCAGDCTCTRNDGIGLACAPPNTGGCSTTIAGCTCRASNSGGGNLNGTCSGPAPARINQSDS